MGIHASCVMTSLDHLVPLCSLMEIPVLCQSQWMQNLVELYYPDIEALWDEGKDYCYDETLKDCDVVFTANPSRKYNGTFHFFDHVLRKKVRSVCSFHGQSDKKQTLFWLEKFADEDIVLSYGPYMKDFFQDKGILERIPHIVTCGNYRYEYYLKYRSFFDALLTPHLFPENGKKTLLYAPTWTHPNRKNEWRIEYSSFFHDYPYVLDHIPADFQVYVKLHPMLVLHFPQEVENLMTAYQERENIRFLNDMPLVYPLLAKADLYLGDFSSVGYDFLAFNRPLFFLSDGARSVETDKGVYLHQTGTRLLPEDFSTLYQRLGARDQKKEKREEVYRYGFGEKVPLEELRKAILGALA